MNRVVKTVIASLGLALASLPLAGVASAAETGTVGGPFGTTVGVWQPGCRTEQNFSSNTKTLYVEEPIIRKASSTSFVKARLTVWVWSMAKNASTWTYEPALSYSKVAAKSYISAAQPDAVVSFGSEPRAINLNYQGYIHVAERLEYLDPSGRVVGGPVDFVPTPYTYVYSYYLGIKTYVNGVCQF
jgi:hypothetical protein